MTDNKIRCSDLRCGKPLATVLDHEHHKHSMDEASCDACKTLCWIWFNGRAHENLPTWEEWGTKILAEFTAKEALYEANIEELAQANSDAGLELYRLKQRAEIAETERALLLGEIARAKTLTDKPPEWDFIDAVFQLRRSRDEAVDGWNVNVVHYRGQLDKVEEEARAQRERAYNLQAAVEDFLHNRDEIELRLHNHVTSETGQIELERCQAILDRLREAVIGKGKGGAA